jgi:membrane-associated phospholipid phosphatase
LKRLEPLPKVKAAFLGTLHEVEFLSAEPALFARTFPVRLAIRLWEKMMEDRGSFFTSARLPIATAVLAPGIFIADTVTRVDIAVPVLYVAVVLFSPRFWRPSRVAMAAAGCAALILSYVITRNTGPAIEGMARAIGSPVFISSVPNV